MTHHRYLARFCSVFGLYTQQQWLGQKNGLDQRLRRDYALLSQDNSRVERPMDDC